MADKKQDLPFGWVVKQSKSHPDRIYYFNINTGASTWEFPDLLQHYVNGQESSTKAPVLTSTSLKSVQTADDTVSLQKSAQCATNVPQKKRVPQTSSVTSCANLVFGASKNSTAAVHEAKFLPQVSGKEKSNEKKFSQHRFIPRSQRKTLQENVSETHVKSSKVQKMSGNPGQWSLRSDQKKPVEQSKGVVNAQMLASANRNEQNQRLSQTEKAGKLQCKKMNTNTAFAAETRKDTLKGTSHASSKPAKPTKQMECFDTILNLIQKKLHKGKQITPASPEYSRTAAVNKSVNATDKFVKGPGNSLNQDTKGIRSEKEIGKLCNEKSKSISNQTKGLKRSLVESKTDSEKKAKLDTKVAPLSSAGKDKNTSSSSKGKEFERNVKKPDTDWGVTCDKRKVVKSRQSLAEKRSVALKEKKLRQCQMGKKNEKVAADFDLTVSTRASQVSDGFVKVTDDKSDVVSDNTNYKHNKNTEFKLFIGDKEKLLSIQSWINNLQEDAGSESPSLSVDSQARLRLVNDSVDSGYVSTGTRAFTPTGTRAFTPTTRGWPGVLKSSGETSREIIAMEIDECFVSHSSPPEEDAEELMDIDEVLVEVRQQVNFGNNKHTDSFGTSLSDTPSQVNKNDQTVTVVVDTNVLITDLEMLEDLKDYQLPGTNLKPCLFIPWIVLCELDALKETVKPGKPNLSLATQRKARQGISFLKNMFSNKHPRVIGQSPKQAEEASRNFKSRCNDDVILQACIQCQKSVCRVVLLTNDNNLINKSFVSSVAAYSAKDIKSGLQKATESIRTPASACGQTPKSTTCQTPRNMNFQTPLCVQSRTSAINMKANGGQEVKPSPSSSGKLDNAWCENSKNGDNQNVPPQLRTLQRTCLVDRILQEEKSYTVEALVDDIYCKMKSELHEAFGKVLETEMKKAYDDIWMEILYRKPPWSLKGILECWKKHWIAVFGLVFPRHLSNNVNMLLENISSSKGATLDVVCHICDASSEILLEAKHRNLYGPRIPAIAQTAITLRELSYGVKLGSISTASISSLEQYLLSKVEGQSPGAVKETLVKIVGDDCQNFNQCTVQPISTPVIKTMQSTCDSHTGGSSMLPSMPSVLSPSIQLAQQTHIPFMAGNASSHADVSQHCTTEHKLHGSSAQNVINAGRQNSGAELSELIAGQHFTQIWNFIYNYCNEFYNTLSGTSVTGLLTMEPVLKQLVSSTLEIRKYHVGLLQLPVDDLKNHEEEFTMLGGICNSFFTKFNDQEERPIVTPLQLLILYSKPEYRETLTRLLAQLDEMLHLMYQCLNKLCPDD